MTLSPAERPTPSERLIARANAAISGLRHGAERGDTDAPKALRLAKMLQEQLERPDEQPIIHGPYCQTSWLATQLYDWGPWIEGFIKRNVTDEDRFVSPTVQWGMG